MNPTSFAATLGNAPKVGYLPGLAQAPAPRHPSLRPAIIANLTPPTERQNPAEVQRAGAVIGGMAAALAQLDHFTRQLQGLGPMRHQTRQKLMQLVRLSDEVLATVAATFDSHDADAVNVLSEILGQSAELMLQLQPDQIEKVLRYQHTLATTNLNYTPAP